MAATGAAPGGIADHLLHALGGRGPAAVGLERLLDCHYRRADLFGHARKSVVGTAFSLSALGCPAQYQCPGGGHLLAGSARGRIGALGWLVQSYTPVAGRFAEHGSFRLLPGGFVSAAVGRGRKAHLSAGADADGSDAGSRRTAGRARPVPLGVVLDRLRPGFFAATLQYCHLFYPRIAALRTLYQTLLPGAAPALSGFDHPGTAAGFGSDLPVSARYPGQHCILCAAGHLQARNDGSGGFFSGWLGTITRFRRNSLAGKFRCHRFYSRLVRLAGARAPAPGVVSGAHRPGGPPRCAPLPPGPGRPAASGILRHRLGLQPRGQPPPGGGGLCPHGADLLRHCQANRRHRLPLPHAQLVQRQGRCLHH